jgi:hypothetical protein
VIPSALAGEETKESEEPEEPLDPNYYLFRSLEGRRVAGLHEFFKDTVTEAVVSSPGRQVWGWRESQMGNVG